MVENIYCGLPSGINRLVADPGAGPECLLIYSYFHSSRSGWMSQQIRHDNSGPMWKPQRQDKKTALDKRATSKRELMKEQPATHEGLHHCYIGDHWVKRVDLEHVIDASVRPDLRDNPLNHRKACNRHNLLKKQGNLTVSEQNRVNKERQKVLEETTNE